MHIIVSITTFLPRSKKDVVHRQYQTSVEISMPQIRGPLSETSNCLGRPYQVPENFNGFSCCGTFHFLDFRPLGMCINDNEVSGTKNQSFQHRNRNQNYCHLAHINVEVT